MAGNYRLADSAMLTRVAEETVLLDSPSGNYFSLDEPGTAMLEAALSQPTEEAAVNNLEAMFDAPRQTLLQDYRQLVDELRNEGLLVAKTTDLGSLTPTPEPVDR